MFNFFTEQISETVCGFAEFKNSLTNSLNRVFLPILSLSFSSFSHSGRTNSEGCHNVKKTGGYHCHGSGSSPKINNNSNDSNQNDTSEIVLRKFKNRYCYDGDTCYVTINGEDTKIRLLELDTPEISKPKCDQELEWGLRARDYVNNLIANANTIEIKTQFQKDLA